MSATSGPTVPGASFDPAPPIAPIGPATATRGKAGRRLWGDVLVLVGGVAIGVSFLVESATLYQFYNGSYPGILRLLDLGDLLQSLVLGVGVVLIVAGWMTAWSAGTPAREPGPPVDGAWGPLGGFVAAGLGVAFVAIYAFGSAIIAGAEYASVNLTLWKYEGAALYLSCGLGVLLLVGGWFWVRRCTPVGR